MRSGNSKMRRRTFIATFGAQMLQLLFLLEFHSVALLQPALCRRVLQMFVLFVNLLCLGQGRGNGSDSWSLALRGLSVAGWDPAERRTRSEEREQVWGELVGHGGIWSR